MSKNTIKIDGAKLKQLLEERSGRSLYQISEDEGFSRNFLSQACRSGKASPIVQSVAKKYSVRKEEYILPEKELKQMSIEDIETDTVSKKTLEKTVDLSRDTYNDLVEITNKAADMVKEAFEVLSIEWNKAVKEYMREIEKIKEGLK